MMKKAITAKELLTRELLTVDVGDGAVLYMRKPSAAFGLEISSLVKSLNLVDSEGKMSTEAENNPDIQTAIINLMNGYLATHVCDEDGECIWETKKEMLESPMDVWECLTDSLKESLGLVDAKAQVEQMSTELNKLVDDADTNEGIVEAGKAADVPLKLTSSEDLYLESRITSSDE